MSAWLNGKLCAFDTETTGIDVRADRIVTASIVYVTSKGVERKREWLINPGIEIPERATAIHGVTNERARQDGVDPLHVIPAIGAELSGAWATGWPVVIMNAPFDLTLLQEELERVAHDPVEIGPVLDPLCIDRGMEPYRRGKRTLEALAALHGAKQEGAHSSTGDALTSARVVWKQAKAYAALRDFTLPEMQDWQRKSHDEWAGQFELWLRQQGKPEVINREWPVRRAA